MLGNVRHYNACGKSKKSVDPAHPFGVTTREIVVDGHNMDALAFKRIQIASQRFRQRFTFTGAHFGNFAAM